MPTVKRWIGVADAGLLIQQDGADHGLQIATDTGAIVNKNLGDTAHVSRARIARHQLLDKLTTDKRRQVGMMENIIKSSA